MTHEGPTLSSALTRFFATELRVWRGQMPLAVAFWGYGVVASVALAVLYATAVDLEEVALQQSLLILGTLYTAWALTGIWRCAANASLAWGHATRLFIIAWALNSAFVVLFLQLDLLVAYGQK